MTPDDRDTYFREGYLLRRQLFPSERIEALNARFDAIVAGEVAPAWNLQVVRNVEVAKGLVTPRTPAHGIAKLNFIMGDEVLADYANFQPLLDEVEALLGFDLIAMNSMYLSKPPDVDARHPMHQDLLYFPFRPPEKIVATWTALQPVIRKNGCLAVVPGSHTGGLLEHKYPDWEHKNFLFLGASGADTANRVHLEMQPGDTVLFHPLLVHGSGFNRTTGLRRAIAVHYASAHCSDIWDGETTFVKGYDPRLDYRLVRGSDPNGYVRAS